MLSENARWRPSMTTSAAFGGFDFSLNQPAVPNVGANFGASGPYANYVWLKNIPIDTARKNLEIHNNSTSPIVVVLDDGRASAGQAPTGASMFSIAAASVAGGAGGVWQSATNKRRAQIYGPSGQSPQVAVFCDSN